ncbi:hypothetical protein C7212DRAFT_284784 [Tuber magnatum]|uniref:Uncharacterized protein n=1 Tax=Tuber magnatum TaxID=42249 RepID=A0A317SIE3_9PEZI|nr:hypothetical protein C7212DRAFT_284784 [Tuber magnatum]
MCGFRRVNRRFTGDSDSKDSARNLRSPRTSYSEMVSPAGSACGFRGDSGTPTTTPSVDSPAMSETSTRSPSISYPDTPAALPFPLLPLPCCRAPSGLGGVCEKCTDTATARKHWVLGVEAESTYKLEPPGFGPIPETPLATTYEDQSSPLLLSKEEDRSEGPAIGLGIEMRSAVYEEQSSLLTNPPPTPPPERKERKGRPPPVSTAWNRERRIPWEFEKNCDTANATATTAIPSSKHTGAAFALARVQNVRKNRSTFEGFQEMSCTLENCPGHGGNRDPTAPAATGSKRDSDTTLAASMHNESEGRSECKRQPGGMYCALKHCGGCQVDVDDRVGPARTKRGASRIVDGLVTALTKGISWLRGKGWRR